VPKIEHELGIEVYASKTDGFGGLIKQAPEDFIVREILVNGSKAEIQPKAPLSLEGQGRYLVCTLVKYNIDTFLSIKMMAKDLGISERRIQIAGMKDKKAVTAQHISIENVKPKKLNRIRRDDIRIAPLRYSPTMVFPHMSFGNNFIITIRGISGSSASIHTKAREILEELHHFNGVPNFFGHQRFGTIRPITHLVGKAILRNDFEEASLFFLAKPSLYEHPESREVRQKLMETRNFKEALNTFPYRLTYERQMLSHLANYQKDYRGAFKRLPQRLNRLFLQAYQSYLFNRFLSHRLMEGISIDEPRLGDYLVKTDRFGLPTNSYVVASKQNLEDLGKAVKAKEMYVALPLVGFKQAPSTGQQGEIEQKILEEEDVKLEDFRVTSFPRMGAKGGLRAAIAPIMDLDIHKVEEDRLNPNRKSMRLDFTLYRGCYATVVLREFMKPDDLIKAGF
jgi:tRNA pseudouridine13 synthase